MLLNLFFFRLLRVQKKGRIESGFYRQNFVGAVILLGTLFDRYGFQSMDYEFADLACSVSGMS